MTPAETSALLNVKGLTIAELRASQPALANAVDALVSEAARKRFQVAIGALPAELQRQVAAIDLTAASGDVIAYLEAELHKRGVAEGDVAMVTRLARRAGVGGGLTPTQPVGTQPDVAAQVNMALINAHMQAVTTLAGLTDATATSVAKAVPSPSALDDTSLTALVSSGALSAAQAKTLGFTVALYKLTDENADLATAVKSGAFAALGNKAPESIDDLAKLSSADWSAFLASSKMTLPAGATQQSVAKALAARFALLSPNVALLGRLAQPAATSVTVNLATLAPLYRLNSVVVGAGFSSLVKTGLAPEQLTTMGSAQAQLQQLANAYPGLALAAVLDDRTLDAATKGNTVTRRIGLVQQVGTQLGQVQLLRLDLSAGSADLPKLRLANIGATAAEQAMVLSTLRAYQRVWAITNDVDVTHTVVAAGFSSAMSIATLTRSAFTAQSTLDAATAQIVWNGARTNLSDVTKTTATILDLTGPSYAPLKVRNVPKSALQYLAQLPGYQDLFGHLSYCNCTECQSILGPAAYFVDLMKFIDDNLRSQFTQAGNPIDIAVRRPDLWTLPLTCDNIDERIPTLEIVDEVLENYIARLASPSWRWCTTRRSTTRTLHRPRRCRRRFSSRSAYRRRASRPIFRCWADRWRRSPRPWRRHRDSARRPS